MKGIGAAVWREWELGSGTAVSVLRVLVLSLGLLFLCFTATLIVPWPQQVALALLTLAAAVWLDRTFSSYLITLTLMLVSAYSTFRYGFWRIATTLDFVREPGSVHHRVEVVIMILLLLSECYAFMALLLGYVQIAWPLRRTPVPLPEDTREWPAVDVLIPTLNEPLEVVRFTALAAANMDWPADHLNIYILDDGRRDEFRCFAEEAGLGYMTRADDRHAKAGNLNAALERVDSPFVVIFDADHVPTRSFLQVAMGWFLRDAKLGIVQTSHHFYSPDPFERNLRQFRTIPNEDELFYGVIQDGNDFWNAAWFCGSCAVLRRTALDEAGGMAVETATEDAHTSLRMQRLGWNSAYINIPQAAGLATERLSEHVRQRIRWARGMVQILRLENPLFARGLTLAQRLCYFNAMSHFLYALPRLIFLTAPLMYLIFGYSTIAGSWAAILAYAAPHLILSSVARARIQGAHRHSFWTEIYETVLAPYLLFPTIWAFLRPRAGRFRVTSKGTVVGEKFFDGRVALPTLLLLSFNWLGLCCTLPRLIQFPVWRVPSWAPLANWPATLYDPAHKGTVLINCCWTVFNLVLLGVASAAAWESRQRRKSVRVETQLATEVILPDGSSVRGTTSDLSSGGLRSTLEYALPAQPGDEVRFVLPVLESTVVLPATIVAIDGRVLRAKFDHLGLEELESLTLLLYARADRWLGWDESRDADRPVHSLFHVLRLAMHGLVQTMFHRRNGDGRAGRSGLASALPLLTLVLLGGFGERSAGGQQRSTPAPAPGSFQDSVSLRDAGLPRALVVPLSQSERSVAFGIAQNELVKTATLHLVYRVPSELAAGYRLAVALNGTTLATLPSAAIPAGAAQQQPASSTQTADIPVPAELLLRSNQLSFQLSATEDSAWNGGPLPVVLIDPSTSIDLAGTLIPLQDELALLPVPFYQPGLSSAAVVTIAFATPPSPAAQQAAAVVASWLGVIAGRTPLRFVVETGPIPKGNAIVFAETPAALPASLNLTTVTGPTLAMRTNPDDPYGKLLILTGARPADLVEAARALASRTNLEGSDLTLSSPVRIPARSPDDAPRWVGTSGSAELRFGSVAQDARFTADQAGPASVSLLLPPSLFFGDDADGQERRSIPLHLGYQYNAAAIEPGSHLDIEANGQKIATLSLSPATDSRKTVRDTIVDVPVSALRPLRNTLVFRFVLRPRSGLSWASAESAATATLLKDSWLDLRGIPHWTELPNVGLFLAAGYPFTRYADLSGTAIVLPPRPSSQELSLLLTLMAHIGAQTGYPATKVSVVNPERVSSNSAMDYLVLGTMQDMRNLASFNPDIPVTFSSGSLAPQRPRGLAGLDMPWHTADPLSAAIAQDPSLPDLLLEGIEWPRRSRHSLVLVLARDEDSLPALRAQLLAPAPAVSGSLLMLRQGVLSSFPAARQTYMLGRTTPLMVVINLLSRLPWVIATLSLIFCFLIASVLRTLLRRGARMRLQGTTS